MKALFSRNELQLLDCQMATLNCELANLVSLFESRLGENNDFATSARLIEEGFATLAGKVHMHYEMAVEDHESKKQEGLCRKKNLPQEVRN